MIPMICVQCHGGRGPIGEGTCALTDDNGGVRTFTFETRLGALRLPSCYKRMSKS